MMHKIKTFSNRYNILSTLFCTFIILVYTCQLGNAQNVGIGTDQPIHPVHIVGNTFLEAGQSISNLADTSAFTIVDEGEWQLSMDGNDIQNYDALFGTSSRLYIQRRGGELNLCNGAMLFQPFSNRIIIPSTTRLGIGVASPSYPLDINGALQLNQNITSGQALFVNGAEALWYNGTYFSWGHGGSANYFERDVGIGVSNPQAKLHVNGDLRVSDLAGGGVREVRVNNAGELFNVETFYAINPASFNCAQAWTSSVGLTYGYVADGLRAEGNNTDDDCYIMVAGLQLKDSDPIGKITLFTKDANSDRNLKVQLFRKNHASDTAVLIGEVSSSGTGTQEVSTTFTTYFPQNQTESFFLKAFCYLDSDVNTAVGWGEGTTISAVLIE